MGFYQLEFFHKRKGKSVLDTDLPRSLALSVVCKVVLDPLVDPSEGHLAPFAGGAVFVQHGQADEGGVGERGLGLRVTLVVHLLLQLVMVLGQLVNVCPLVDQDLLVGQKYVAGEQKHDQQHG